MKDGVDAHERLIERGLVEDRALHQLDLGRDGGQVATIARREIVEDADRVSARGGLGSFLQYRGEGGKEDGWREGAGAPPCGGKKRVGSGSVSSRLSPALAGRITVDNVGPITGRAGTEPRSTYGNYTAGPVRCIGWLCGGRSAGFTALTEPRQCLDQKQVDRR